MMNREVYLKNIADNLALLSRQVFVRNAISLYDINIVSESFYSELLNLINGWSLKNANAIDKNAPAIDLIDDVNRISIQVTSDNTSKKIKHTIREFIKNHSYQDLSIKYLDEAQDNPVDALNKLVAFFEEKLGSSGKKYDQMAIKFYLINEMIKCNVFPNERGEYNGG